MLPAVGIVYTPVAYKSTIWLFTLLKAYLILSSPTDSTDQHSYLVKVLRGLGGHWALVTSNLQMVSTPFICGFILVVSASIVRWYCYRILGHLFTFQLAVLPDHELITHGPYSFVRHPAYTATMLISIGVPLVYSGPGSLLYELYGPRLMQICRALGCGTWFMVGKGVNIEDQMLKTEFGKQWND
jgi:protein-S-isoprenylcysteine O-methyltransferase Ste14